MGRGGGRGGEGRGDRRESNKQSMDRGQGEGEGRDTIKSFSHHQPTEVMERGAEDRRGRHCPSIRYCTCDEENGLRKGQEPVLGGGSPFHCLALPLPLLC